MQHNIIRNAFFCFSLKISMSVTPRVMGARTYVAISMEGFGAPAEKAFIF